MGGTRTRWNAAMNGTPRHAIHNFTDVADNQNSGKERDNEGLSEPSEPVSCAYQLYPRRPQCPGRTSAEGPFVPLATGPKPGCLLRQVTNVRATFEYHTAPGAGPREAFTSSGWRTAVLCSPGW